jgi:hypothetical protein
MCLAIEVAQLLRFLTTKDAESAKQPKFREVKFFLYRRRLSTLRR